MRSKKQPNMVLDPGRAEMLLRLTDEEAGKIIKALIAYANTRALPEEFSGVLLFCFKELMSETEQIWDKRMSISERNRKNAQKRWGSASDANGTNRMRVDANDANGTNRMRVDANDANGINRIQAHEQADDQKLASEDFNPMQFLMTGEEGEPIVVYKHG